jgi:hypothetical protein
MNRFMHVQKRKIEVDKWCEGVGRGCDPGRTYVAEWITSHAEWFRVAWQKSLCRFCGKWQHCGYRVCRQCGSFEPNRVD